MAKVVPFTRILKRGSVGIDVLAVKRALSKAGHGRWLGKDFTRLYGPFMVTHVKNFQKKHNIEPSGFYGRSTHKALAPFFDAYGASLMVKKKVQSPQISNKRAAVVAAAWYGYNNRGAIHYTQSSLRMYGVRNKIKPPRIPRYEDCSSFATWCYWMAKAADPNGLGYRGWGWTGTLQNHGHRISASQMKPGDLVFYGPGGNSHVTIYVGHGHCISHGSERGPLYTRYDYRTVHSIRSYL